MMIFVRRGEKTQKEYKEVVFAFKNFTLFLCTYSLNREALPRGRAHARAHETGASVLFLSLLLGAQILWESVCLSESVLLSADNEWILNP